MVTRTINDRSVYEYVFLGGVFGDESLFAEVNVVPSDTFVRLGEVVEFEQVTRSLCPGVEEGTLDDHLRKNEDSLSTYFGVLSGCFGGRIDSALSGGYDSRFILALLLGAGVVPRLHVYGEAHDPDVGVAKEIGEGEGIPVTHIDKSKQARPSRERYATIVEENFRKFDGYPDDGIFDYGANLSSRRDRSRGEHLVLNGGGGEIFRNNTYLLNKTYRADQVIAGVFYRGLSWSGTRRFSQRRYLAGLVAKLKYSLGEPKEVLERSDIEFLLPVFWWKYWMARNNCINNRFGPYLTPMCDHNILKNAISIPVKYKYIAGKFQSALMRTINSRIATYNSAYGFDFNSEPPLGKIFKEYINHSRPTMLRKYSASISNELGLMCGVALPEHLSRLKNEFLFDAAMPHMSQYFDLSRISSELHFTRIYTLEYFMERCQPTGSIEF
jgi:asparagine synthase (glutamine-hydrolysing)